MKNYRVEMLSSHFCKMIIKILYNNISIFDNYGFLYDIKIKPAQITITKALTSKSARSMRIMYVISGCNIAKKFIEMHKKEIIRMLKKHIKMAKFPTLIFKYDSEYESAIKRKIEELQENDNSTLEK